MKSRYVRVEILGRLHCARVAGHRDRGLGKLLTASGGRGQHGGAHQYGVFASGRAHRDSRDVGLRLHESPVTAEPAARQDLPHLHQLGLFQNFYNMFGTVLDHGTRP